jgi:hypothetical protein
MSNQAKEIHRLILEGATGGREQLERRLEIWAAVSASCGRRERPEVLAEVRAALAGAQ